jgi:hypothetical protein
MDASAVRLVAEHEVAEAGADDPRRSTPVLDDELGVVADVQAQIEASVFTRGDAAVTSRHHDVHFEVVKSRPGHEVDALDGAPGHRVERQGLHDSRLPAEHPWLSALASGR